MNKITIIVGHPLEDSLSGKLAKAYLEGAKSSGAEVKITYLGQLNFDPLLRNGYRQKQELEPDLKNTVDNLLWANHWVFVTPLWWGTMPALLKGFFDRTFLSGIMFKYQENSPFPLKLMKGKSVRVLITMDGPLFYYRFFIGNPLKLIFKKAIFNFCGVNPVKFSYFSQVRKSTPKKIDAWINKTKSLGRKII